jgi:hypothetical protein
MGAAPAYLFTPHPGKQALFMARPERTVGYGGSAGCGKTDCLVNHHLYIVDYENQRVKRGEIRTSSAWVIYFRRIMPNTRQTEDRIRRTFPLIDPLAPGWNASDHIWTWSCGVKWQAGGMEQTTDFLKYYGAEYTEIDFDELTEFEEEQFDQLDTRLRTADPALAPFLNIRWASNPAGDGLVWVRRRFVEVAPPETTVRYRVTLPSGQVVEQDQIFIQAYLADNPSLARDGKYEAALRKAKPHIYRALLKGDWYVSVGAFLSDFWDPEYHVCPTHPIPPNVHRFRSADFGIAGTEGKSGWFSCTWWYVDHDLAMTAYNHLYLTGLSSDRIAERIKEIELYFGDWDEEANRSLIGLTSPLDAQCFKRTGTSGPTISEDFWRRGVTWKKSTKDRVNGVAELVRRFDTYTTWTDAEGIVRKKPAIRWMKRCEFPIRFLPTLGRDPLDPRDIKDDIEGRDIFDDTMYACTSRPLRPAPMRDRDYDEDEEEDQLASWRRRKMLAGLR